jgi:hypothetical protein
LLIKKSIFKTNGISMKSLFSETSNGHDSHICKNVIRLPYTAQISPMTVSNSLLQLADLVWDAGMKNLASELIGLAHSAFDDGHDTEQKFPKNAENTGKNHLFEPHSTVTDFARLRG